MFKRLIKVLFLFSFALISAFILLELTARYVIRQPYYAFPEGYFVNNEFYGYELAKNFKGTYSQPEFSINIDTNSQGLRDVNRETGNGEYKILALGDSFTFGLGVELNDTYLNRLEDVLNNHKDGKEFSIIKAGVVGYSTFNEKVYLEKKGLNFHPNMVIVQFWWDDLGIDRITYLADTGFLTSGKIKSNAQLRLFLNRHFRSYALLRRIFTVMSQKALFAVKTSDIKENQASLNEKFASTVKEFKEIEALCLKNGIACLFVLIPSKELVYDSNILSQQWQSFCEFLNKNNIQYLDCLPALIKAISKKDPIFFSVDPHLNKKGHEVIAEEIYEYLFPKLMQRNNN